MIFTPYPRYFMESVDLDQAFDTPFAIISINEPDEVPAIINTTCMDILRLYFHDAEKPIKYNFDLEKGIYTFDGYAVVLFNALMAKTLLEFVNLHKEKSNMLVHCLMGACRSPAVCAALTKIMYDDDERYFKTYTPNMLVYRTILETNQKFGILT